MFSPQLLTKKSRIYLTIVLGIFLSSNIIAQELIQTNINPESDFRKSQVAFEKKWEGKVPAKGTGYKQFKRWEYFWEPRLFPTGEMPDMNQLYTEYTNIRNTKSKDDNPLVVSVSWQPLGPDIVPDKPNAYSPSPGNGRMNCIECDPNSYPIIWAGAPHGGVWKTTNEGYTWETFPFTEFMSIGITDIAVAPSNSNCVYAATGDADAAGIFHISRNYSIGVVKTTDGGETWSHTSLQAELEDNLILNRIIVHPDDENIVYLAANLGIFKTTNGGDSWEHIYSSKGCRDLEFKVNDPKTLFGAFFTRSGEEGTSYFIGTLNAEDNSVEVKQQFSGSTVTRIALAVTPASYDYIYAVCADQYGNLHSVYLSTNAGQDWNKMNSGTSIRNGFGGQCGYDLAIAVSPENKNEVVIGGLDIFKSTNAGASFTQISDWTGYYSSIGWVHADIHDLDYNPRSKKLFSANDGGVNKSENGGETWTDISNGLSVAEIYAFSGFTGDKNKLVVGCQDNGTHLMDGGDWEGIYGGDGFMPLVDYSNSNVIYASYLSGYGTTFVRSTNGGGKWGTIFSYADSKEYPSWITPIAMDPQNSKTIYIGHYNVWKSTNRGDSWENISGFSGSAQMKTLVIAPSDPLVIYAGYSTYIYASYDGGGSWDKIVTSGQSITDIAVHPTNPDKIWYTVSGYSSDNKVYEYVNENSKNISSGLPNVPVNTIVYQENANDRLFIGTDFGVYVSEGSNRNWTRINNGLPNVVVADLQVHKASGMLRAATFGRGMWETQIVSCDIEEPVIIYNGSEAPDEIEVCEGEEVVLELEQNYYSVEWSNGATGNSIIVTESGDYNVTAYDKNGCAVTSMTISVTVHAMKDLTISVKDDNQDEIYCIGEEVVLSARIGFSTYEWSDGSTDRKLTVDRDGQYYVIGTSNEGCVSYSDTIDIQFLPSPDKPGITESGDTLFTSEADAYQWYYEDELLEGETNRTYVPSHDGYYTVEVFNQNGCSTSSDEFEFTSSSVKDIRDFTEKFELKPNPTDGIFNVYLMSDKYSSAQFTIIDIHGRNLYSTTIYELLSGNTFTFDLTNYSNGTYFLNIQLGDNKFVEKIIKR